MLKPCPLSSMALACCLVLSGCAALGPDFHAPTTEGAVPAQFARQQADGGVHDRGVTA